MAKRECICGCDKFRFKLNVDELYRNICRNCNHTLAEHLNISKQAE